jgi:hypothetical protein
MSGTTLEPASHTTSSRRLKTLIVSWEFFRDLFIEGEHPANSYRVLRNAIPSDAVLVNARYVWPNSLELLIHSESYPEVKEGEDYPNDPVAIAR